MRKLSRIQQEVYAALEYGSVARGAATPIQVTRACALTS
jgi:hypothetical protein